MKKVFILSMFLMGFQGFAADQGGEDATETTAIKSSIQKQTEGSSDPITDVEECGLVTFLVSFFCCAKLCGSCCN